jgi:hypothetical protein
MDGDQTLCCSSRTPADPTAVERRTSHGTILWLSIAVVLLAATLQDRPPDEVFLPALKAYPLPQLCSLRRLTGYPCPGCGMTRSFIRLAHGDFAGAFRYHPIGPLFFLVVLMQIPYRWWRLRSAAGRCDGAQQADASGTGGGRLAWHARWSEALERNVPRLVWMFAILLLGTWAYRLATLGLG